MENKYLLSYLRDFYDNPQMNRILDYFKVDFDNYLYGYGCQFSEFNNREKSIEYMYGEGGVPGKKKKKTKLSSLFIDFVKRIVKKNIMALKRSHLLAINREGNINSIKKVLFLSNISFATRLEFEKRNIQIFSIDDYWNDKHSDIYPIIEWYNSLNQLSFKERLQIDRYECLDIFIQNIQKEFKDFDGLFVGNDEYFICKLFIDAFKDMGIPTFNWCHGIDCALGVPKRVDYQLVWGRGVKENLVNAGGDPSSIIVSGNINYFNVPDNTVFRNSLDDVLVLTSATVANIRHTWDSNSFVQWDRSQLILYIFSVEKVLKSVGVKHARLRPHPINNKLWVDKFIDTDFYIMDTDSLSTSFKKATLAIGPTSSTFIEALRAGLTYLVYEPVDNAGKTLIGGLLRPPFDGSDENLKVAFTEDQLKDMIEAGYSCNKTIMDKYIVPFNIDSFVQKLGNRVCQ